MGARHDRKALLAAGLLALAWAGCDCGGADVEPPQRCDPYWLEGVASVEFGEVPYEAADYEKGLLRRDLTVLATRPGAFENNGFWTTVYDYQSGWIAGQLRLETAIPWQGRDLNGKRVRWESLRMESGCGAGGMTSVLAEDVLRDQDGRLLIAVVQAPLSADPEVPLLSELTPELSAQWKDLGCETHRDSLNAEAETVGLVMSVDGTRYGISLGERVPVTIEDRRYQVAVSLAERLTRYDCGTVAFMIYDEGFLIRPHDVVNPPKPDAGDDGGTPGPADGGRPDTCITPFDGGCGGGGNGEDASEPDPADGGSPDGCGGPGDAGCGGDEADAFVPEPWDGGAQDGSSSEWDGGEPDA